MSSFGSREANPVPAAAGGTPWRSTANNRRPPGLPARSCIIVAMGSSPTAGLRFDVAAERLCFCSPGKVLVHLRPHSARTAMSLGCILLSQPQNNSMMSGTSLAPQGIR